MPAFTAAERAAWTYRIHQLRSSTNGAMSTGGADNSFVVNGSRFKESTETLGPTVSVAEV